jgi:hypothetical protein
MTAKHIHVILLTPDSVPAAIVYFTSVADALETNEYVKNPTPTIAVFRGHIADLAAAQAAVKTLGAAARDAKLKICNDDADSLRNCVEVAVNANPGKEAIIADSAKMALKKAVGHRKTQDLQVESNGTPGDIRVIIRAANKKAAYIIEYSLDGGKTWVSHGVSTFTDNVITGLPLGATVLVRFATVIGHVQSAWSDPVSFVVH